MVRKKIVVELLSQEYILVDGSRIPPLKIFAIVNGGKTITLKPKHGRDHFKFFKSEPELAVGVINLMQEAMKLISKERKQSQAVK